MTTHSNQPDGQRAPAQAAASALPHPTNHFRQKAWREFQRALDPLAPPKPLRRPRHP